MAVRLRRGKPAAEAKAVCPLCARSHRPQERFCRVCGVPLRPPAGSYLADPTFDEPAWRRRLRQRARLLDPRLAEGEPVPVAGAQNEAEAELLQGLLLEEGIPSLIRRPRGFDVPDFLAGGPRELLVPAAAVERAREILAAGTGAFAEAEAGRCEGRGAESLADPGEGLSAEPRWFRGLGLRLLALALVALLAVAYFGKALAELLGR